MTDLPLDALSVRQPWAYSIIFLGKPIENRSWNARFAYGRAALAFRGRVCIHASKGMTRDEYEGAKDFIERTSGRALPPPHELLRGGIIGTVNIVDVVRKSNNPWFFGPVGLVLEDPHPVEFIPCSGELGFFKWRPDGTAADPPKRWMLPKGERPETQAERAAHQGSLL